MKSSKKEDQEVWKRMREERKYMYIVAGKSSLCSLHSQSVCYALSSQRILFTDYLKLGRVQDDIQIS